MPAYPTKDYRPGFKIDEDGIYDMPIEEYHGDCCDGPSISSSGLRIFANPDKTPAHYWAFSYLNPDRIVEDDDDKADHFSFGQAAHMLLLGESGFRQKFALRPAEIDGKPWQGNRTVCREWLAEQKASGRSVLKAEDFEAIKGMAKSLARDPIIKTGLISGDVEKSLIWKDPETGVWLKARPDALPTHADMVADIKTTVDASPRACDRALTDYGYHIQLALAGEGIKHLTGRDIFGSPDMFALVFIEKKAPWLVNVRLIDDRTMQFARMELRRAIRRFAECWDKQEFPGYEAGTMSLPAWRVQQLENEAKTGLLENVK